MQILTNTLTLQTGKLRPSKGNGLVQVPCSPKQWQIQDQTGLLTGSPVLFPLHPASCFRQLRPGAYKGKAQQLGEGKPSPDYINLVGCQEKSGDYSSLPPTGSQLQEATENAGRLTLIRKIPTSYREGGKLKDSGGPVLTSSCSPPHNPFSHTPKMMGQYRIPSACNLDPQFQCPQIFAPLSYHATLSPAHTAQDVHLSSLSESCPSSKGQLEAPLLQVGFSAPQSPSSDLPVQGKVRKGKEGTGPLREGTCLLSTGTALRRSPTVT